MNIFVNFNFLFCTDDVNTPAVNDILAGSKSEGRSDTNVHTLGKKKIEEAEFHRQTHEEAFCLSFIYFFFTAFLLQNI